jgi:hypothetical protein
MHRTDVMLKTDARAMKANWRIYRYLACVRCAHGRVGLCAMHELQISTVFCRN